MKVVFNGLWPGGLRHGAKDVGQTFVGKGLTLVESIKRCAFTHSIHALKRLQGSVGRMVSSSSSS